MMTYSNESINYRNALKTKEKWENIIQNNIPYPCKKCGENKKPCDFVKQYIKNNQVGKYQYLYECKECKKKRVYSQRHLQRNSIEGALEIIYKQLKAGAKKRNLEFNIKYENLLELRGSQKGNCYYTGYSMQYSFIHFKEGKMTDKTNMQVSCDRLNNNKGYIDGNIVLCCTFVNKMKGTMSEIEFIDVCSDVLSNFKRSN